MHNAVRIAAPGLATFTQVNFPWPWATWLAAPLLFASLAGWVIWVYNRLVRHRNLVAEAFSGIDVQLKRRHELIPNLIEVVKGYSQHEKNVLEDVARLRTQSQHAGTVAAMQQGENALTDRLKSLLALVEAYPELRADAQFRELQDHLAEIEDQIQYARRYYNGAVREYNTAAQSFPGNVVAGVFKFKLAEFFEIQTVTQRQNPQVDLK